MFSTSHITATFSLTSESFIYTAWCCKNNFHPEIFVISVHHKCLFLKPCSHSTEHSFSKHQETLPCTNLHSEKQCPNNETNLEAFNLKPLFNFSFTTMPTPLWLLMCYDQSWRWKVSHLLSCQKTTCCKGQGALPVAQLGIAQQSGICVQKTPTHWITANKWSIHYEDLKQELILILTDSFYSEI